ncbi:MAG: putative DNA-binding domain-containing protein [Rhizobiaceae bacterium]|nr:putative DNA-binding domain-containing protein [Rhizobiaceae bacterium]
MGFTTSQHAFAAALLDPGSVLPEGVTSARGAADPLRFAVYRNNVFVSLVRALAQRFPVTERLVGEEFFRGMARTYAADRKPASPLMFEYGGDFPDFVASFPPAAGLPYLADVARIEAVWTDAYHAADAPPLGVTALAAIPPDRLAASRLVPHPSAGLVRSAHPAGSIWAGHRDDPVMPPASWVPETVLVVRPEMNVNVHALPAADAAFAAALLAGASLGEASGASSDVSDFDFGAALVGLVTLGAFRAIAMGEPQ